MISIVIPCKNRLHFLRASIKNIQRNTLKEWELVVVDYNCPQKTFDYCTNLKDVRIKPILAPVERNEWNLSKSRNLGFIHSKGELVLFLDADTLINDNFLESVTSQMKEGYFLSGRNFEPYHCSGCCAVWRKDFEKVKGYNELFEGWGSEELNLYDRLKGIGLKQDYFNLNLIKNIPHNNNIRNQFHGNKTVHETNEQNWKLDKNKFSSIIK